MKMTINVYLVPCFRMSGVLPPAPPIKFIARIGKNVSFVRSQASPCGIFGGKSVI